MDYSPALSATSEMTDEELDMYFASYVPLSNLPTPPPAKEASPEYAHDQESISQSWSQCLDRFAHADSQGTFCFVLLSELSLQVLGTGHWVLGTGYSSSHGHPCHRSRNVGCCHA